MSQEEFVEAHVLVCNRKKGKSRNAKAACGRSLFYKLSFYKAEPSLALIRWEWAREAVKELTS